MDVVPKMAGAQVATAAGLTLGSKSPFATEATPLMMALNVHTFINLYGYGYHNVYELDELLNMDDPRVTFEGTAVQKPYRIQK